LEGQIDRLMQRQRARQTGETGALFLTVRDCRKT
jgi:hypothetical protein